MAGQIKILLLEDNFLIGLETAQALEKNGFGIIGPYGTIKEALAAIDASKPDIALLDINLGDGKTSEPFADELVKRQIPFLFLTGYGSANILPERFNKFIKLNKPTSPASLIAHIEIVRVQHAY